MPGFELFGDKEKKQVQEVLDTGVLMRYGFDGAREGRWKAAELEKALEKRMKVNHAQLVSSGTAALKIAMKVAGVSAGDEVIMPTFTFVASFEAILELNAIPIIVNVDDTLTLDPDEVEKAITKRTKAIMPVHMCGSMADLGSLREICAKHNLIMVEDACQAIGGSYNGKPLGSYGDMGCFSFDYVKTITCGEGGAIITNNKEYFTRADAYSDHGHDHLGKDRGADGHPYLGFNYRISELNAAVGLAQIKRLDSFLKIQKNHYTILRKALEGLPEVTFRKVPKGGVENYSFLNFFLPTREDAKQVSVALAEAGLDSCFYWYDNNWHYIKNWEHLKGLKTMGIPAREVYSFYPDYGKNDYSRSDEWIGRNISCLIKLSWTSDEVKHRAKKMADIVNTFIKA